MSLPLPEDHSERLARTLLSLEGLAIGDAFGEMLAYDYTSAQQRVNAGLNAGPWFHTDDTQMALSIVDALREHGRIDPADLAQRFAARFRRDPDRGYGSMARRILHEILQGRPWESAAGAAFGGSGSMGNGAAMRVAPLGAYFAGQPDLVSEAVRSALPTHAHREGQAGAVAVAVAAATAWSLRDRAPDSTGPELLSRAYELTPAGETRSGLARALKLPFTTSTRFTARQLGNGSAVTAPDTVPFAIWSAAKYLGSYRDALIETVAVGGDCDTNCAIVGSIVALHIGLSGIPKDWQEARERFDFELS